MTIATLPITHQTHDGIPPSDSGVAVAVAVPLPAGETIAVALTLTLIVALTLMVADGLADVWFAITAEADGLAEGLADVWFAAPEADGLAEGEAAGTPHAAFENTLHKSIKIVFLCTKLILLTEFHTHK